MKKTSELFEGPDSSLRKAFDEATREQEDTLDTLVRDLTTVHPMPKSEVRRRLSDFIERAKAERDEEIREWARKNAQPTNSGFEDEQRRILLKDLINFLSTSEHAAR